MSNSKKHKILQVLFDFYENKSLESSNYTDLGKSMSLEQLHKETKINLSDLKAFCKSLENSNLICPIYFTEEPSVLRYYINDLGTISLKEKYFLNLLWYKDYRIVIPALVSSVISIIGILISMSLSKDNTHLEERTLQLEQKLDSIQKIQFQNNQVGKIKN
jgi:hypothetical protein